MLVSTDKYIILPSHYDLKRNTNNRQFNFMYKINKTPQHILTQIHT